MYLTRLQVFFKAKAKLNAVGKNPGYFVGA
jgi:hypothetical protein